ncbi:C-terminal binding protein [Kocuria oceani]|uniref:C-terminal binding protein n=1 Tax=Kocuria oceani TaxID=988827 RepID=UPI004035C78E
MSGKIVVTDHIFGSTTREQALAERLGLEFSEHQCQTEAETVEAVAGAGVVLVNFAPMTRRVLEALEAGATVVRYGIGYDNVDVEAARELGILVCNVPDYGADTVADHTVASLLALLRKLSLFDRAVRERGWLDPGALSPLPGFADTTIGLVGTGRIGRAVAARLQPFGFRIVAHDPFVEPAHLAAIGIESVELDELLAAAHAVSLHAPLTAENRHLIGQEALERMRPGAVLVNTSRGGLVDPSALVTHLRNGKLGGAALDVFEPEPLPLEAELRTFDNVLLTPHAAFFSDASLANLQRLATEEAARALGGQPLRCQVA